MQVQTDQGLCLAPLHTLLHPCASEQACLRSDLQLPQKSLTCLVFLWLLWAQPCAMQPLLFSRCSCCFSLFCGLHHRVLFWLFACRLTRRSSLLSKRYPLHIGWGQLSLTVWQVRVTVTIAVSLLIPCPERSISSCRFDPVCSGDTHLFWILRKKNSLE